MPEKKKPINKRAAESQVAYAVRVAEPDPPPVLSELDGQIKKMEGKLDNLRYLRQCYLNDSVNLVDGTREQVLKILADSD